MMHRKKNVHKNNNKKQEKTPTLKPGSREGREKKSHSLEMMSPHLAGWPDSRTEKWNESGLNMDPLR